MQETPAPARPEPFSHSPGTRSVRVGPPPSRGDCGTPSLDRAGHCSFVPPYLLRHLAETEHGALKARCTETLRTDANLRVRRATSDGDTAAHPPGLAAAGTTWVIYTADNTQSLPGRQVRSAGEPATGDLAVDEASTWSSQVLQLFAQRFHRDSLDGRGTPVSSTVHYGEQYDNAFWDGRQLVFGDGDGVIFERFTKPMDVFAHEFTHGVTQYTAGLAYQGQSGALNESVSDVFASIAKQHDLGQTAAEADWLIGVGLFLPSVQAKALRSMLEPGTAYDDPRIGRDPQVGSMDDYVTTTDDSGGVHINSGIPNRAFALAAIALGGSSWERAGQIWYEALTGGDLTANTDFAAFARATVSAAGGLFPGDVTVAQKVRRAWGQVGVLGATSPGAPMAVTAPSAAARGGHPSSPTGADTISVRRSGGFAGLARSADLDLNQVPEGQRVRELIRRADLQHLSIGGARSADHFVYTVEFGQVRLTLPEQALTPELAQVIRIVLGEERV
jgi:Thermolysin metallopeptidase, alpha-helical domain/Thermolysin metallopeptidase, catalytic domain/Emfourin